jgi:transcription elongation GreA/GreB family factor
VHPDLEALVHTEGETPAPRAESLIVSWPSLQRRKEELEHIEKVMIPQNIRDIATARSYGDLRENFEFKSAKEQQAVLNRQKGELELMLNNARGTNFENADTAQVSIGTVVTLEPTAGGNSETYSILGAWDSSPEHGFISYKAGIGQCLLETTPGTPVELPSEHGARKATVESIKPFTELELLKSNIHRLDDAVQLV